jgi:hypothetical protein
MLQALYRLHPLLCTTEIHAIKDKLRGINACEGILGRKLPTSHGNEEGEISKLSHPA